MASRFFKPSMIDPQYMKGDNETPEYLYSSNNEGGTYSVVSGPIGSGVSSISRISQPPKSRRGAYHEPGTGRARQEENISIGPGAVRPGEQGQGRSQVYCRCPLGDYATVIEEGQNCVDIRCPHDGQRLVNG